MKNSFEYDPRDDSPHKKISPETAFRYTHRFGGTILLLQEIRGWMTDDPIDIVSIGPGIVNNEKIVALIKRDSLFEDCLAWAVEDWQKQGTHPDIIALEQKRSEARAYARQLRKSGLNRNGEVYCIIKDKWDEQIAEHVASLYPLYQEVPEVQE